MPSKYVSTIYVIARCPETKKILLGGVGFAATGTWWRDDDSARQKYRGYNDAEIVKPGELSDDFGNTGQVTGERMTIPPLS